jgi:phosphatidylserine/phosphatidylglycerophosphate/cardiolipin synthase-like enzyme
VSLILDSAHYERVTLAIARAKVSVWISTANVKQLLVQAPVGTRDRARGKYVPIADTFQSLADRGVQVRLLHAAQPSRPFREELARRAARLVRPGFEMRACPRVHLKMIAIDGALLYLGSANLTGAGLGAKSEGRRNFEMGVLTDDEWLLDQAQARFDRIWRGLECAGCRMRSKCPRPIDVSYGDAKEMSMSLTPPSPRGSTPLRRQRSSIDPGGSAALPPNPPERERGS